MKTGGIPFFGIIVGMETWFFEFCFVFPGVRGLRELYDVKNSLSINIHIHIQNIIYYFIHATSFVWRIILMVSNTLLPYPVWWVLNHWLCDFLFGYFCFVINRRVSFEPDGSLRRVGPTSDGVFYKFYIRVFWWSSHFFDLYTEWNKELNKMFGWGQPRRVYTHGWGRVRTVQTSRAGRPRLRVFRTKVNEIRSSSVTVWNRSFTFSFVLTTEESDKIRRCI